MNIHPVGAGMDFAGKRIVVTGAASGIGQVTAALIRELGGEVVALDWKPVVLEGVRSIQVDLGDPASIDAALGQIGGAPVDALCNVAAVASGMGFALEQVFAINYLGARRLTEGLVPLMPRGGAIVCVTSGAARAWREHAPQLAPLVAEHDFDTALACLRAAPPALEPYPLSKMAMNLWAWQATPDLSRQHGLRINLVAPGVVDTQQPRQSAVGSFEQLVQGFTRFVERIGEPIELARTIAFLASPAASFINGQLLEVDGGMSTIAAVERGEL
jgi:NAD(P)-dependent dehydrogenase (short-subunit alcohol dehydrogenase family)